jgi:hypothetical protein
MNSIRVAFHSDLQKFITGACWDQLSSCSSWNGIQWSFASVWRTVIDSFEYLRLGTEPAENVGLFADKIPGYCHFLEGTNRPPKDVTVIFAEAFIDCSVEPFKTLARVRLPALNPVLKILTATMRAIMTVPQ